MSQQQLIAEYLAGPELLRKAVAGMSKEQVRARPVAGKWSTLEVVCHLADFDPILADRMKRIISHEKPLLFGADEKLFAKSLAYEERDLEDELKIIELTRKQMARILAKLPADAFASAGVHSERGLVTLEQMLQTTIRHIPHHVKFIEEKRAALKA
jgi:hypothetical protein